MRERPEGSSLNSEKKCSKISIDNITDGLGVARGSPLRYNPKCSKISIDNITDGVKGR